ncbi:MAG: hypothetical protein M1825_005369 [Sarcosagium campestre]|nr:MAG: hypothetical protein M1825_005369 [Sarcosagium campestre]
MGLYRQKHASRVRQRCKVQPFVWVKDTAAESDTIPSPPQSVTAEANAPGSLSPIVTKSDSTKPLLPRNEAERQELPLSPNTEKPRTTTFHIYHEGFRTHNYSIHLIKDTDVPLPQVDDPAAPNYVDDEKLKNFEQGRFQRFIGALCLPFVRKKNANKAIRKLRRELVVDNAKFDERTNTSPYYVHRPYLAFHDPPYTLHRGGKRRTPTICLLYNSWFWHHSEVVFSELLARDDVVDPRGVVTSKFGSKDGENGTIKGYKLSKRRMWMETGKDFHRAETKKQKDLGAGPATDQFPHEPLRPDETVRMAWKFRLWEPRTYYFKYGGIQFFWKGTATVKDPKFWGIFLAFNHLKLVAVLPESIDECSKESYLNKAASKCSTTEICIATYTSVMSHRKAGRLRLFDDEIDRCLAEMQPGAQVQEDPIGEKNSSDKDTFEARRTRLIDIIMGTGICMIINEEHKRDCVKEIVALLLEAAQNAGG